VPAGWHERVGALLGSRRGTTTVLRNLRTALVASCVLFAIVGAVAVDRRHAALGRGDVAARRLLDVQAIRVAAVGVDAIATNSFLVAGDSPEQRQRYVDQLADAQQRVVTVAAGADVDAAAALGDVNRQLGVFGGLVEQARANNRQGFPVGAAYLRQANQLMSNDIVGALRQIEQDQRDEVNQQLAAAARTGWWLHVVGWPLLALVGLASAWIAGRFRRVVNVPLVIAGLVISIVLIGGALAQGRALADADNTVGGALLRADVLAQARGAAFDARSNEALTLINRGNGAANEAAWRSASNVVIRVLGDVECNGSICADLFDRYVEQHAELRALDDGGRWDDAVSESQSGAIATTFAEFDDSLASALDDDARAANLALSDAADSIGGWRWVLLGAGFVAALLMIAGLQQRLREYS
jgi:hypothetical protein